MIAAEILPPNSTAGERALAEAIAPLQNSGAEAIRTVWDPETCPADVLPWMAWGISIDIWDPEWTEAQKRAEIAAAIPFKRRKGTRAAVRETLDRFDPQIGLIEWFEADPAMEPHRFRLDLPLAADSDVDYSEERVAGLVRDIAAVKPARSHMTATHFLPSITPGYLLGAANPAGFVRSDMAADTSTALDGYWDTLLQTEQGAPLTDDAGAILEDQ